MADQRIVQCFGIKRRPHKEAKFCRRRWLWTSRAAGSSNFGRKGTQACPHCGTSPDFRHPVNQMLGGRQMSEEEYQKAMNKYLKILQEENNT